MASGSSEQVRAVAAEKFVHPAILAGKTQFSVAVKDVMKNLQSSGFPSGNYPQVCSALSAGKFLRENGLELDSVDGPPSGQSSTVVFHYRVASRQFSKGASTQFPPPDCGGAPPQETLDERADRLTERLRGLLKAELAEYGGGEAFLRWVRSEDDSIAKVGSAK